MPATSRRPADLQITPRQPSFDLAALMKKHRYWHNDDPVMTHFFNAMQATFPQAGAYALLQQAAGWQHVAGTQSASVVQLRVSTRVIVTVGVVAGVAGGAGVPAEKPVQPAIRTAAMQSAGMMRRGMSM